MALLASAVLALLAAAASHGQSATGEQITNLDQLLESVRQSQQRQRALNARREQQFLQDNQRQKELIAQARRDFEARQRQNQPLLAVTENNAREIAALEKELEALVQEMGDLASTFREFAGDFSAVMRESMITAQFPGRSVQLRTLAAGDSQPTIEQIEALWLLLQEEIQRLGGGTTFPANRAGT